MDERLKKIKEFIKEIPKEPGIYMMKDIDNNVIYVGKAINLKNRVSQYFNKNRKSNRILKMTTLVHSIEYIVTRNEVEALVLECNYIKNLNPKFNVMLRDDKTYPYLKINIKSEYPILTITRRKMDDGNLYFGPYPSAGSIRDVISMLNNIFPLKKCKYNLEKRKVKPCIYYHMNKCLAPCLNDINKEKYNNMIKQVVMFLNGKTNDIKEAIKKEIDDCIECLDFERADILKKRIDNINKISIKQSISNLNELSSDVIGYIYLNSKLYMQIFKIRGYKIIFHENFEIDDIEDIDVEEILMSYISQYYNKLKTDIPKKIYVKLDDAEILEELLNNNVKVIIPKIGEKLKLIEMVENNIYLGIENNNIDKLKEIKELIGFDFRSIESYDISNLRNDYIVGAMIRVDDGKLNKKLYRRFKIKSTYEQNDPLCIYEVILRRFKHTEWEFPDVIFIDGGITQVNACNKALKELNLDILVYGMIKDDRHRTRGMINSDGKELIFKDKNTLNFITFIQDEIHRFAITYHRMLRDKGMFN